MDELYIGGDIETWKHHRHIYYSDGDHCAAVEGNLALGIDARDMARLFCAAPKLLEACKRMVNLLDVDNLTMQAIERDARDVITAAEAGDGH